MHAHNLHYLPDPKTSKNLHCLSCKGRFKNHHQALNSPCNATTVHLTAVPKPLNPFALKHPDAITLMLCGTRPSHTPKEHATLPGEMAANHHCPANTCLACAAELATPNLHENWTLLR